MITAYMTVLQKYTVFSGRANRSEYWWFALSQLIIHIVLAILASFVHALFGFIDLIYLLATLVPTLAVGARRLHDSGKTGWLQLIWLVPIVGWIIVIVLMALRGDEGENKHGPQPA